MIKEIPQMGNVPFGKFYNKKNIKIIDLNTSPIKNVRLVKRISNKTLEKCIDNTYIFSLLSKRKVYYVYECIPQKLLSYYRYDIYIKYFYVKSYVEKSNYMLAKRIYLSNIKAFNNFKEPDGRKVCKRDFIINFNNLINSIRNEKKIKTIIPISKTGISIDGAHRIAICLYFNINIPFVVFDLLDGKYDKEFFENRGMKRKYIEFVDEFIKIERLEL